MSWFSKLFGNQSEDRARGGYGHHPADGVGACSKSTRVALGERWNSTAELSVRTARSSGATLSSVIERAKMPTMWRATGVHLQSPRV